MDEIEYEYSLTMTRQEILTEQLLTDKKNQFLEVLRTADSNIVDIRMQGNAIKTYHRNNPAVR